MHRGRGVTVRRKTVTATAATTVFLIVVLCEIARIFLIQGFADIERSHMADSMERAKTAIQDEILQLDKISGDNATFDDTYRFMREPSAKYLQSNFGSGKDSTLARENYQALVFVGPAGEVVAAKGYDPVAEKEVPVSASLTRHFSKQDKLMASPLAGSPVIGIVETDEGPMLVSARPILSSEGRGPVRGILLMGSYLKPADLTRLEQKTHLSLSLGLLDDRRLSPDFVVANKHLASDSEVFVNPLDGNTIAGYALFRDIYGKRVLVLKAQKNRATYRQGQLTLFYLAGALAIAGIAFGVVIELLLEKILVSRLSALDGGVRRIAESRDPSARVVCTGDDELARFGEAINGMLDSLQLSRSEKRVAEDRYRTFMENSPLVATIKDEAERYVYVNERLAKLYHTTPEQMKGRCIEEFLGPEGARMVAERDGEVLACGHLLQSEEIIRTPEGDRNWLCFRFPLPSEESKRLIGLLALDITDRKKAEQELVEAKEAAESAALVKSRFLMNMSHEIRTPMNGIIGLTELTLATQLDREQQEHISLIRFSAESLLAIVNDLLDFSKIEAGKLEIDPVEFDLREMLTDCVALPRVLAKRKGIRLFLDAAYSLPRRVFGDPIRLRQVLLNLLGNAVKFTLQGEIRLSVAVAAAEGNEISLHFVVSDTGIGIPESKQNLVFESFSQADSSTTRQFGGTGLGLSISKRLVEMMGGRMWVESRPGEGSRFHFTATVGQCVSTNAECELVAIPSPAMSQSEESAEKLRILIAEDNQINQLVLQRLLKSWGHETVVVDNGRKALQVLEREIFDILITDIQMPEMDGYELSAAIQKRQQVTGRALPILGLTAHAFDEDRAKCFAAGMDAYLAKPIRPDVLKRTVNELAGAVPASAPCAAPAF